MKYIKKHGIIIESSIYFSLFDFSKTEEGGNTLSFPRREKKVSDFVAAREVNEKISFVRNDHKVIGTIEKILENSVIVEISEEDADKIGAPSTLTVVSHKKYSVVE